MSEDKIYPSMVIRIQAEAIELLEQENKQLKEVIEEVRKYIEKHSLYYDYDDKELYPIMGAGGTRYRVTGAIEILDIVNKVLGVKDE